MRKTKPESKSAVAARDLAWAERALETEREERVALAVPLLVFLAEALDAARFVRDYWDKKGEGADARPGLSSAVKKSDGDEGFSLKVADEIIVLHELAQRAQTNYLLATRLDESSTPLVGKGEALLDELTAVLEWAFDDGVQDDRDAQLAAVKSANEHTKSIAGLASALRDYAALAEKHIDVVQGPLDFDRATIDEARKVSKQLDAFESNANNADADVTLARRNKLLVLLQRRVALVRKAAQLVFRRHPEIARRVTSAYLRRSRAASRRREAIEPEA